MLTGLGFVLLGLIVLFYPRVLVVLFAGCLILFGLGLMATSWQFRRLQRRSESRVINWIIRY